jgi:hypothetical protein
LHGIGSSFICPIFVQSKGSPVLANTLCSTAEMQLISTNQLIGSREAYRLNGRFLVSPLMANRIESATNQDDLRSVLESIPVVDLDESETDSHEFHGELCLN